MSALQRAEWACWVVCYGLVVAILTCLAVIYSTNSGELIEETVALCFAALFSKTAAETLNDFRTKRRHP